MTIVVAAPVSPEPNIRRGASMKFAPRNAATAPVAVATEFMVTTRSRGTTSGSAADSPEVTNRLKPLTVSARQSTNTSPTPVAKAAATPSTSSRRAVLAAISTDRRSQRSSSAPANGPSKE